MITDYNNSQDNIEVELPEMQFNYKDVKWQQQGYELIGLASNGLKFGIRVNSNLRLVGVDENNKPILKKIDT